MALVLPAVAWALGELTQKSGTAGCISETGTGGACLDGTALDAPQVVVTSPDGRNVYAATALSEAIAIFDRDPTTGALTQKAGTAGCISETGTGGACQDGIALLGASGVVVSPDGMNVYATSSTSDAIAIFDRDPTTGALTQKAGIAGCISETGTGGACQDGVALDSAVRLTTSFDGKSIYAVAALSDSVAIVDRNPTTGALTQKAGTAGCISETGTGGLCQDGAALDSAQAIAISPDDKSLYVAAGLSDAVSIFDRDATSGTLSQKAGTLGCISETGSTGACRDGTALDGAQGPSVSPDGKNVYVASGASGGVAVFDRDSGGQLTQKPGTAGCVTETGTAGACQAGPALSGAEDAFASPDGASLYVASSGTPDGLAIFDRDAGTGAILQKTGSAGCISMDLPAVCQGGTAVADLQDVSTSADGKNVYAAASGTTDAIATFDRSLTLPPGPSGPGQPPSVDELAPTVSAFSLSRRRFRVGTRPTPVTAGAAPRPRRLTPRGSSFRFRLSEPASARIVIERARAGRKVRRRCRPPSRELRRRPRCTRFSRAGTLTRANLAAGRSTIKFSGRIGRRALKAGRYRATLTATDSAGNRSKARRATFSVVR
jgi:DNA-binding beta-propeller fold protein YncE